MITIRCSDLDRVLECHGSLTLVPLVAPRQSDDGVEGTALHYTGAARIIIELGGVGHIGKSDPAWPSIKFSKWISDYYVRHVQEHVPAQWSLEAEAAFAYEFAFAEPVTTTVIEWFNGAPITKRVQHTGFILSGHIDCVAVSPDSTEAIGWDLKTGYDPVDEAEQNWQMLGYMVLLKRAYPNLKKCTFYVVQPRNDEDEGFQRVSCVTLDDDFAVAPDSVIEDVSLGLIARIRAALADSLSLNSGRKQCRFCPAKLQCPATISDRESMKLTMTETQLATIRRVPDDSVLADWVLSGRVVGQAIEDAEKMAKERIAAVGSIAASDGTRIGVKVQRGSYKVTDPESLWTTLKELLPETMLATCAKWSFSAIKDKLGEHMNIPKSGKGAVTSETVFDAKVRTYVEQGERKVFTFQQ